MSNCEQIRKNISTPIYGLGIINKPQDHPIDKINDDACKLLFKTRKPGSENKYTNAGDFDTCKKNIEWARTKYKNVTDEMAKAGCPLSGGMRKRRTSRRTKRKRNTLKKNKRTKRRSLKKTRRTRKRTRIH